MSFYYTLNRVTEILSAKWAFRFLLEPENNAFLVEDVARVTC